MKLILAVVFLLNDWTVAVWKKGTSFVHCYTIFMEILFSHNETLQWLCSRLDRKPCCLQTMMQSWLSASENRGKHKGLETGVNIKVWKQG